MTWQCKHSETKRLARASDKVLLRWQHMCLMPAWARWEEKWLDEKRMRRAAQTVLRRQNMRLEPVFSGWSEHATTQRRMALATDKIVRRWINLALSPAMSWWMACIEEKKRLVRVCGMIIRYTHTLSLSLSLSLSHTHVCVCVCVCIT
jgi:hypothetical protein